MFRKKKPLNVDNKKESVNIAKNSINYKRIDGGLIDRKSLSESVDIAIKAIENNIKVNIVAGDKLNSNDFYVLANILEDYPNLLTVYKYKFVDVNDKSFCNNSPEYNSAMIGKNLYFENKSYPFQVAKVIENIDEEVEQKYIEKFNDYKKLSKELNVTELRKFAKRKEQELNK